MRKMNPVNWFEIPTLDLDRAKAFYTKVFQVDLIDTEKGELKLAMFPDEMAAYGTTGALVYREGLTPSADGTTVYFYCKDLSQELQRIEQYGGKILLPKTAIGEHGFIAQFLDTEGNRVALHTPLAMYMR